jgi:hypothetical protein
VQNFEFIKWALYRRKKRCIGGEEKSRGIQVGGGIVVVVRSRREGR